jgi:hypothetical protein
MPERLGNEGMCTCTCEQKKRVRMYLREQLDRPEILPSRGQAAEVQEGEAPALARDHHRVVTRRSHSLLRTKESGSVQHGRATCSYHSFHQSVPPPSDTQGMG